MTGTTSTPHQVEITWHKDIAAHRRWMAICWQLHHLQRALAAPKASR